MEGDKARVWANTDPGMFAEHVSAFALDKQGKGKASRHGQQDGPKKRFRETLETEVKQVRAEAGITICQKYNKYRGDCKYGAQCQFQHICSRCRGLHPVSQCTKVLRARVMLGMIQMIYVQYTKKKSMVAGGQ